MADSKREIKVIFREDGLAGNSYRGTGLVSYDDLRPTVLKRETPSYTSFSQPDVFRSLDTDSSELGDLHPTPIFRSITHESTFPSSTIPPPSKLGVSSKTAPFSTSHIGTSYKATPFSNPYAPTDDVLGLMHSLVIHKDLPKEPPPVPGGYLEPSYHFISRSKPSSLLDAIPKALVSLQNKKDIPYGIDFDVNPQKYRVKCVAYPCGEPKLPFMIRVFFFGARRQR